MNPHIKRLSYQRIGEFEDEFLSQYHTPTTLPIPIEQIAEKKLRLKVFEEMDLKKNYDIDAFLASDLRTIFIDFNLYMNFENRARFTIAHEIGHVILHGKLFQKFDINSVEMLGNMAAKITDEDYRWLEYQVYSFASHVLVPKQSLHDEIKKTHRKNPKDGDAGSIDTSNAGFAGSVSGVGRSNF